VLEVTKILFFTHYFPPHIGGASVVAYEITKRLAKRGYSVTVAVPSSIVNRIVENEYDKKHSMFDNLRIIRSFPLPYHFNINLSHLLNAHKILRLIKDQGCKYDAIISCLVPNDLTLVSSLMIRKFIKGPFIIKSLDIIPAFTNILRTIYGLPISRLNISRLGKIADKFLVVSSELKDFLIKNEFYDPNKIGVSPNGVDTMKFSPNAKKIDLLKKKFSCEKIILYLGSMQPDDHLTLLIEAIPAIIREFRYLKVILIGGGTELSKLKRLTIKKGVKNNVVFLKKMPHKYMPQIIAEADICIGPLRPSYDNFYAIPMKILEYMACGKPVISAKLSKDILVDDITGLVLKKYTPKELTNKIEMILTDDGLARKLGKKARELVVMKFDWNKIVSRLEKDLESAC